MAAGAGWRCGCWGLPIGRRNGRGVHVARRKKRNERPALFPRWMSLIKDDYSFCKWLKIGYRTSISNHGCAILRRRPIRVVFFWQTNRRTIARFEGAHDVHRHAIEVVRFAFSYIVDSLSYSKFLLITSKLWCGCCIVTQDLTRPSFQVLLSKISRGSIFCTNVAIWI